MARADGPRAHEATTASWPEGAPSAATIVVHRGTTDHLALADLTSGALQDLAVPGEDADPAWSVDGARLAYRAGSDVLVLTPSAGTAPVRIRAGVLPPNKTQRPFAFSPDGRHLAVAGVHGMVLLDLSAGAGAKTAPATPPMQLSDLTWGPDSQHLAACRWFTEAKGVMRFELVEVTVAADGTAGVRSLVHDASGCELLGLRRGEWLIRRRDADLVEEVFSVSSVGKPKRLVKVPVNSAVVGFLPSQDAVLVSDGAEDEGDPTRLSVAPLSGGRLTAWLRTVPQVRRMSELAAQADGEFALLTIRAAKARAPAGTIFLGSFDGKTMRQVLPAPGAGPTQSRLAFSHPVLRPMRASHP